MFARLLQQEGSEEGESGSSSGGGQRPAAKKSNKTITSFDEVGRRGRGRPPGSKSKSKPSPHLIATPDHNQCSMRPLVLEIPGGTDVVNAVFGFAKRRNIGLCVLTASGTVTNVSLRQPCFTSDGGGGGGGGGAVINLHGRFDILSVSATFIPPLLSTNSFTISLAGPQGQIIGGSVAGALAADAVSRTVESGAAGGESHGHYGHQSGNLMLDQSGGMPAYRRQVPSDSDIIWASTSPF
ncbi:hypothetical protein Sjap_022192 [Stephania japonica]|uniref:PPC domain-containing protein n=1 Tax=Stephania japonica TaxID=461633 RepID=A0AAP0ER14_9MAGN